MQEQKSVSSPKAKGFVWSEEFDKVERRHVSVIIPGFLTEGTFCLGCYSGGGKTWLALQLAKSVATGCDFLGVTPTRTGKVLFLELEMGQTALNTRRELLGMIDKPLPIAYTYQEMRSEGLLPGRNTNLTEYLEEKNNQMGGDIALVVIDVWRLLRRSVRGEDPEIVTYNQVDEINAFCNKHHAAVVILHHNRKMSKDSLFQETKTDSLSGSNALPGAVKGGNWILGGKKGEARSLYVELKDDPNGDKEYAIEFDKKTCTWVIDGLEQERVMQKYLNDPIRLAILALIGTDNQYKLTSTELAAKVNEMNEYDGEFATIDAQAAGRKLNDSKFQTNLKKVDHLRVGQRSGGLNKYYPIERIKEYPMNFDGTPEQMTIGNT